MKRRTLLTLGLLALVAVVAVNTGGFVTTEADRAVEVAVADDGEAYLGVQDRHTDGTLTVTVTNRFGNDVRLDATVVANGTERTVESLSPGESSGELSFEVDCEDGTVEYDVTAVDTAGDVRTEASRTVGCDATGS